MKPETEKTIMDVGNGAFSGRYVKMLEEAERSFAEGEYAVCVTRTNIVSRILGTRKEDVYLNAMVCFTNKRMFIGQKTTVVSGLSDVDYADVKSVVSREDRLKIWYIDISTDTMRYEVFASKSKNTCEKIHHIVADAVKEYAGDDAQTDGQFEENIFDQIRQLGELKNDGLLTDEEFNTKKAELLSRL